MVVLMKQLGLVERQVAFLGTDEIVALKLPSLVAQVLARTEQVRVVGHVEHSLKLHAPRILLRLPVPRFPPEHAGAAVHLARNFHVAPCAEDRAGARVGLEQQEIL